MTNKVTHRSKHRLREPAAKVNTELLATENALGIPAVFKLANKSGEVEEHQEEWVC